MSNYIISATAKPATVPSGSQVSVTLKYESDAGGEMSISATEGFEIEPDSRQLSMGQKQAIFDLKIRRTKATTASCDLTFTFAMTSTFFSVKVT